MNYNMHINSPHFSNRTPPFRRSNEFAASIASPLSFHGQQFSPYTYSSPQNKNWVEPAKTMYYNCSTPNSNSSNSYGSPYRFNRYNRKNNSRGSFDSANISIYYDPTAMQNPWAELEKEWKGRKEQKLKSENGENQNTSSK